MDPFKHKSAVLLLLLILSPCVFSIACTKQPVQKAMEGDFTAMENNKVINEYCQSCHIHRNFDPGEHMEEVTLEYKRKVFRKAEECRVCHYIDKRFTRSSLIRKTRWPDEANRGQHRKFEKKIWKELKEAEKEEREEAREQERLDKIERRERKEAKKKEKKSFFGLF